MKLFLIFIIIGNTCFSQVNNDSLFEQLKQIPNDTEQVNQLYQHGFSIRNTDPEFALKCAYDIEQIALKSKSPKHIAKSYNLLGILFYKKAKYAKALKYQKQALRLNEIAQYKYGMAINLTNVGNIFSDINYLNLAETYYLRALQIYNHTGNKLQIAKCLLNIGVLKFNQKQYHASIKQFQETMKYADEISDKDLLASCYNNIGNIFYIEQKTDSALLYFEESLKIREFIGNEFEMADSYINLANVYISKQKLKEAFEYINRAELICLKYEYNDALIQLYNTKSNYFEKQNNFKEANVFLKKQVHLKDSLQKMDEQNIDFSIVDENDNFERSNTTCKKNSFNSYLISLMALLIVIPIYLIRKKR